jgi:hypothetical protein
MVHCVGLGITASSSIIGRLPWKSMGIDDLRDASGEQVWYALSHDFRKMQCTSPPNTAPAPNGCTRINSDTQGQLAVTGAMSASNVVAVLIAPGSAMAGQTRPSNTPSDYVESYTKGDGIHFTFTTNARPDNQLNDRILVITQQELMAAVEPVVAARLERDIAPLLQGYYAVWRAYPFPAPFVGGPAPSNPGRTLAAYKGATTTSATGGLLPLTTDPTFLSWSAPVSVTEKPGGTGNAASSSCSYTWSGGGGGGGVSGGPNCTLTSVDCSHTTSSTVNCEIEYSGGSDDRPLITLSAALRNGALSFPKPVTYFDAFMTDDSGGPVQEDPDPPGPTNTGQWSWSRPPDPGVTSFFQPFVDFNAASPSDGSAIVSFSGRLHNAGGVGNRVTITIPAPTTYDTITGSDWNVSPDTAWFVANEWFRQTYYAASPGFLPAGGNACTNPPPCLQVNNLRPSYTPPSNNKRAVLVLAGRALNGAVRPTSSLADYFENANLTAANGATPYVYENRVGTPASINDRVVVVFP